MRFLLILALVLSQGPPATPIGDVESASSTKRADKKPPDTEPAETFWQRTQSDPLAAYTLALTVFTGILMVAAIYQGRQLRNTVRQMRVSEERQLRAYIAVTTVDINFDNPAAVTALVTLKNTGQTPARSLMGEIGGSLRPLLDHPKPNEPPERQSQTTLGREATVVFMRRIVSPIPPDQANWLVGNIGYSDVFGKPHTTRFCYVTEYQPGTGMSYFRPCEIAGHNDAD